MKLGYSRVSSDSQSLDIQIEELTKAGCERIVSEKLSGTTMQRPELQSLLTILRPGDEVYVSRLDRVSRSVRDTLNIIEAIDKAGATFHCLHQNLETKSAAGRMLMGMLAVFATFENDIRRERQKAGIEKAKGQRRYKGRRPEYDREVIWKCFKLGNMTPTAIADRIGSDVSTVRRALYVLKKEHTLGLIK